jgi:monoamine oxidase
MTGYTAALVLAATIAWLVEAVAGSWLERLRLGVHHHVIRLEQVEYPDGRDRFAFRSSWKRLYRPQVYAGLDAGEGLVERDDIRRWLRETVGTEETDEIYLVVRGVSKRRWYHLHRRFRIEGVLHAGFHHDKGSCLVAALVVRSGLDACDHDLVQDLLWNALRTTIGSRAGPGSLRTLVLETPVLDGNSGYVSQLKAFARRNRARPIGDRHLVLGARGDRFEKGLLWRFDSPEPSDDDNEVAELALTSYGLWSFPFLADGHDIDVIEKRAALIVRHRAKAPARTRPEAPVDVAVVGGGLAGLVTAYRLRDRGIAPIVFEAGDRLGGRIRTCRRPFESTSRIEFGAEFIGDSHTRLIHLLAELGLMTVDLHALDLGCEHAAAHFGGTRYPIDEIHADLEPIRAVARREVEGMDSAALDGLSARDWIESRVPGGLASRAGSLLDVYWTMEVGAPLSDFSALTMVGELGSDDSLDGLGLSSSSHERFSVCGGTELVVQALVSAGEVEAELGHRLVSVEIGPHDSCRLRFAVDNTTREVLARRAVLALPFPVLRDVELEQELSAEKRAAIAELGMGANAKLFLEFETPHWRALGTSGETYSDTGYQCTWEHVSGDDDALVVLVNYRGGAAAVALEGKSPERAGMQLLAEIEPVLPGLTEAWTGRAALATWRDQPLSRGSYSYRRVGQHIRFAEVAGRPEGALHFAGEHTCPDFPGYMEGAVRSGERVAAEVAD